MRWGRLAYCFLLLGASLSGYGQQGRDSSVAAVADTVVRQAEMADLSGLEPLFENVFIYDFFTTLNALHYEHARTSDQRNELNIYYNLTLNNQFRTKFVTLRSYFFNEYGTRHFFDSLTIKGPDNFQIRNVLEVKLIKNQIRLQLGATGKSQFWRTYNYRKDSLSQDERFLYSDYFSPGYITYSLGLSYRFLRNATLDLGLVGGKTTKIRNQEIFETRREKRLYGMNKGERKKDSHGLNITLNVPPRKLSKHIGWEFHGVLFADKEQLGRLAGYTYNMMNVWHYMFLKNLRLSLRTQLAYDEHIDHRVFMMNMFSIGFYLSNKI